MAKSPVQSSDNLLTFHYAIFLKAGLFSFRLVSSRRGFSWKPLIASRCLCSLCQPMSSHLMSRLLGIFISSHLSSPLTLPPLILSSSQLITAVLISPHVLSVHLSSPLSSSSQLLNSTQLVPTQLFFSSSPLFSCQAAVTLPSQLISNNISPQLFRSSSQLVSAHLMSSHLFSPRVTSSKPFPFLLS